MVNLGLYKIMEHLTSKVLKQIARVNGVKDWAKMRKPDLVQTPESMTIVLDNLRLTELKPLAKVREIEGYKKMRHDELVEALSASIPEDDTPIPRVVKPPNKVNFTSLRRSLEKAEESVQSRVEDLEGWVRSKIPKPINKKKRVVTQKFNQGWASIP